MKNRTSAARAQKPEDILTELRTLIGEAEKIVGESIGEHSEEAMRALRERFAAAQEKISELYTGARDRVVAGAHCTDDAIRENPYQALGIAAGVGLLVGLLLGRRSS